MENDWWIKKASEIQHHADTNNFHAFYDAIKSIYGPQRKNITPVRSADGATLYKDKQQILNRWAEHCNTLLNTSHSTETDIHSDLPCLPHQPFGLPPQFLRVTHLPSSHISPTSVASCPPSCNIDDDTQVCVGLASAAFGRLKSRVFQNRNLTISTKAAVYKAVCLSTLLYRVRKPGPPTRGHI
ncbi:hypothetical protein SKAU_G00200220 [Synaphobranchus kaupii]|uniref:Uncharacterized protein n=1 Tax=Synaphobranchus kaupii TaxID=118154 RepID=A0A9Q1FFB2_SYNKA|nr:hypothetical protein SKAU_G00200220 [Synaphobranchus kaupii]